MSARRDQREGGDFRGVETVTLEPRPSQQARAAVRESGRTFHVRAWQTEDHVARDNGRHVPQGDNGRTRATRWQWRGRRGRTYRPGGHAKESGFPFGLDGKLLEEFKQRSILTHVCKTSLFQHSLGKVKLGQGQSTQVEAKIPSGWKPHQPGQGVILSWLKLAAMAMI